jgi:hypothetical protein
MPKQSRTESSIRRNSKILTTLRVLAANDERIIEYFRTITQGKRRNSAGSVVFGIDEKIAKRINLDQFARNIELRCWSRLAKLLWRRFVEAREFAHSLRLKSQSDWLTFNSQGRLPPDIPTNPNVIYAGSGWVSLGDWLGTGTIATLQRLYRPFPKARGFARSLNLRNKKEWRAFAKGDLPKKGTLLKDIPAVPGGTYFGKGWRGWGDWLGTGNVAPWLRRHRSFRRARAFARSLGLTSYSEWKDFCNGHLKRKGKLPADIPLAPNAVYAEKGWCGWGDWLGTGNVLVQLRRYRSFGEARAFVHGHECQSAEIARTHGLAQSRRLPSGIAGT